MLKMIFLCRRLPELSRERYAELVLRGHVPLALEHHPTLRRYVVNIVESEPPGEASYDSIPALYFDAREDFEEHLYDSPAGEAIVHRDVKRFMASADAYATSEEIHRSQDAPVSLGARSPGVKWICPVRRRPGLSQQAFLEHWRYEHVPLLVEHHPELTRLVTNIVEARVSESGESWDLFAELHFTDVREASRRIYASGSSEERLRADRERFTDGWRVYEVGEYVQK